MSVAVTSTPELDSKHINTEGSIWMLQLTSESILLYIHKRITHKQQWA